MPISDEDIVELTPPKMGRIESVFMPAIVKGFGVTVRHMLHAFGRDGKGKYQTVIQYPEERREQRDVLLGGMYEPNFRGVHRLNRDEQGRARCVACFMCATACPADCITIIGAEAPWDDRDKYALSFEIDELRCIYCGMCEEACPEDAIELTPKYEIAGTSRQEMIYDKDKLLEMFDLTIERKPM